MVTLHQFEMGLKWGAVILLGLGTSAWCWIFAGPLCGVCVGTTFSGTLLLGLTIKKYLDVDAAMDRIRSGIPWWRPAVAPVIVGVAIIAVVLLLASCAPSTVLRPSCVPRAIFAAISWEQMTHNPAEIRITGNGRLDHAQAWGWDGLRWLPLDIRGETVWVAHPHNDLPAYKRLSIAQVVAEHDQRMGR